MPVLIQPGSGKRLTVSDSSADAWRERGYKDVPAPKPKPMAEKPSK